MGYTAAVITVSDKGSAGLRRDTSGPVVCDILKAAGWDVVYTKVIPDEPEQIKAELITCVDERHISLVLTTGGTGFSSRDVTPEATLEVVERRTPGIAEAMRAESLRITPKGCLSRGEAGIRGNSLIINLPGSEKAARENLDAVLGALKHGVDMIRSSGSADCGDPPADTSSKKTAPSMDEWLKEAKQAPCASEIGMYLTHNGTVRKTAKARVNGGDETAADVTGMCFGYDQKKVDDAVERTYALPGIYYVRVWLNSGTLEVGDDMMYVLIGGDIRPHVIEAMQSLVGEIKNNCVTETELFGK